MRYFKYFLETNYTFKKSMSKGATQSPFAVDFEIYFGDESSVILSHICTTSSSCR